MENQLHEQQAITVLHIPHVTLSMLKQVTMTLLMHAHATATQPCAQSRAAHLGQLMFLVSFLHVHSYDAPVAVLIGGACGARALGGPWGRWGAVGGRSRQHHHVTAPCLEHFEQVVPAQQHTASHKLS